MKVTLFDLEHDDSPFAGASYADAGELLRIVAEMRTKYAPFMLELVGENGFSLTIGISRNAGCAQYAKQNEPGPYLMARASGVVDSSVEEQEFMVGGTATPIDARFLVSCSTLNDIICHFVEHGSRFEGVVWVEFS